MAHDGAGEDSAMLVVNGVVSGARGPELSLSANSNSRLAADQVAVDGGAAVNRALAGCESSGKIRL